MVKTHVEEIRYFSRARDAEQIVIFQERIALALSCIQYVFRGAG